MNLLYGSVYSYSYIVIRSSKGSGGETPTRAANFLQFQRLEMPLK